MRPQRKDSITTDAVAAAAPAPFIHVGFTTATLTRDCVLVLLPSLVWGFYCFGIRAALVVLASISSALIGELILDWVARRFSLFDGSAFLTGLLLGLAMPPGVPFYVPCISALFAVIVVKGCFGGIGSNWMNPALGGLVFSLISWPRAMSTWLLPRHLAGVAGISGATPLGFVRDHAAAGSSGTVLEILTGSGINFSETDKNITLFLNETFFAPIGAELPFGYLDLLLGNRSGSIGELSGLLLLIGSVILIARRSIRWEIPLSILISFGLLTRIFGGLPFGEGLFSGDLLFSLFSGSFLLVSFFMATDPVTSPRTKTGRYVYGTGVGILTFLLRTFGSQPEGTAFALLMMNCFTPWIDRHSSWKNRPRQMSEGVVE